MEIALLFLVFAIAFGSVFWFWDGLGFESLFPAPFGMCTWCFRIMVCTCRIALDVDVAVAVCVVVGACIDASIDTATRTTIGTISPPSISFGMKAYLFVRVLGWSKRLTLTLTLTVLSLFQFSFCPLFIVWL